MAAHSGRYCCALKRCTAVCGSSTGTPYNSASSALNCAVRARTSSCLA
ncbi:hypothetical protein ACTAE5_07830 [Streptomyces antibioticus]